MNGSHGDLGKAFQWWGEGSKECRERLNGMDPEAVSVTNAPEKLGQEEGGRHYWGRVCGQERVVLFG